MIYIRLVIDDSSNREVERYLMMIFKPLRHGLAGLIVFCSIFTAQAIYADVGERVFYAGFAFVGDATHITENFPYSLAISKEVDIKNEQILEKILRERVLAKRTKKFRLAVFSQGNLNDSEGLALAFALDNETVSVEQIGADYKLVIDLSAQALFFDFNGMKIIGSYPIAVQLVDVLERKPDTKDILDRIRELYIGDKYNVNIFDEFAGKLQKISVKGKVKNSIQVTNVIIEKKALEFLPEASRGDLKDFKQFLARNFSKYLSDNQHVSVLPYSKGYAIGNKMSARFANGEVYNLEIPEPQYEAQIILRGFKKVLFNQKKSASTWVYGSFIRLKIVQPLLGKTYIDEKFKNGATKIVPASQKNTEDWPAFQESIFVLFDSLTKRFSTDRKFASVRKILERCR